MSDGKRGLRTKKTGKKVAKHVSRNIVTGKKGTQVQGGREVEYVERKFTPKLGRAAKFQKQSQGLFDKPSKRAKYIKKAKGKIEKKLEKKGQELPSKTITQRQLQAKVGKKSAKKIIKFGQKTGQVVESTKRKLIGQKGRRYQASLKRKKR